MSKKFIFFILFVLSAYSLHAKEYPDNELKKDVKALRMDIFSLAKRIESLESQEKRSLVNLRTEVANNNLEIATLKQELESLKHQTCALPIELLGKIEEQQKGLIDSKELEHILIKYSNNPDGMSALHYAIKMDDVNAVSLLIANGADVNAVQMDFDPQIPMTALSRAACLNRLEIAQVLLNYGADVNYVYKDPYYCYYPMKYAAELGSGDLVTLLIENGALLDKISSMKYQYPQTPLHTAAKVGNYETVRALIEGGANVNANSDRFPADGAPLDCAAKYLKYSDNPQNLELVKFLVNHGATRYNKKYHDNQFNSGLCPVISGYLQSVGK